MIFTFGFRICCRLQDALYKDDVAAKQNPVDGLQFLPVRQDGHGGRLDADELDLLLDAPQGQLPADPGQCRPVVVGVVYRCPQPGSRKRRPSPAGQLVFRSFRCSIPIIMLSVTADIDHRASAMKRSGGSGRWSCH